MIQSVPLLADVGDWIRVIIPVIFVIIWVLSQVIRAGSTQRPQGTSLDDADEYDDWYEGDEQEERTSSDPLSDEIEAFLRKVRGEEPKSPPAREQVRRPMPSVPHEPQRPVATPAPIEAAVVQATVVEATSASSESGSTITDRFSDQTARLGADVGQADERAEKHMHEAFDHALGSLADTSTVSGEVPRPEEVAVTTVEDISLPGTASEFRDLLSTPESIRKAVVLNEILARPTDRW